MVPVSALRDRDNPRESGFSLIEIIVVMVIIGILLAVGAWFNRSGKAASHGLATVAVAQSYAQAIEQFATDHSRRYPEPVGSVDWPTGQANRGPTSPLARYDKFYVRSVPESVQSGNVGVHQDGDFGRLDYVPSADRYDFELRVSARRSDRFEYVCSFGTKLPASSKPCNKGG